MKILSTLALAAATFAISPAFAAQFDFYKLDQPTAAGDFLPTDGVVCTTHDRCSSNVGGGIYNDDLTFSSGGLTVKATGTLNGQTAAVVQDSTDNWSSTLGAGLGVYSARPLNSSDDNITFNEVLTMTFDQVVNLTRIDLRAEGHNFTGWASTATFMLNGVRTVLPDNVGFLNVNLTGSAFTFGFDNGAQTGDQFYLAGMTAVPAIPEPGTYALMMAGLAVVATMARRRRPAA